MGFGVEAVRPAVPEQMTKFGGDHDFHYIMVSLTGGTLRYQQEARWGFGSPFSHNPIDLVFGLVIRFTRF
jgi:hypothetical protein